MTNLTDITSFSNCDTVTGSFVKFPGPLERH